jgi:hypothetical protein
MFFHIPFRDKLFPTIHALEWSDSCVFSQVDLKIRSSIILLVTTFVIALKLENVRMCLLMISQDPSLDILFVAAGECTFEFLLSCFLMSLLVVSKVLRHLKTLFATSYRALEYSNWHVALQMSLELRYDLEIFLTIFEWT